MCWRQSVNYDCVSFMQYAGVLHLKAYLVLLFFHLKKSFIHHLGFISVRREESLKNKAAIFQ